MQIVNKQLDQLQPYENNSRTHSDIQIDQICKSIMEFGFTNPILIDENDMIIAGHGRLEAAKLLLLDDVPCIVLSGLSDTQKQAYVIADNKLALNAGWDEELLKQEITNLKELDFDLDLIGFSAEELNTLFLEREDGEVDALAEWEGMPEFDQESAESFRHLIVHFENESDVDEFFSLIGQSDTGKTKSIWFPERERRDTASKAYVEE